MKDNEELTYSQDAQIAEYYYYKDINNVNIFVEDENKEYIYETIFRRMFGDEFRNNKIFTVGGKNNMKICFDEFGICNIDNPEIANIYIVDGDFDRYIYPETMINSPNYIYLNTYNIETYFIDKCAVEKYMQGRLRCPLKDVADKVKFDYWWETILSQASELFFCHAYIKKFDSSKKSVGLSAYKFIDDKTGFEKDGKMHSYVQSVLASNPNANDNIENIKNIYYSLNSTVINLICGKFLLDSLTTYIDNICKSNNIKKGVRKEEFIWYLISSFDISSLDYLKNIIQQSMV